MGLISEKYRPLRAGFRTARTLVIVGLVGLNVATLTISGVYTALSSAISAAGFSTVAAREATAKNRKRAATKRLAGETRQKITKRISVQAARNTSSAFAEAIPVAGIAVVAGALALEIKDSCDTARDITALTAAIESDADSDIAYQEAQAIFSCADVIGDSVNVPTTEDLIAAIKSSPGRSWEAATEFYDGLPTWSGTKASASQSLISIYGRIPSWDMLFGKAEASEP